jgi:hypothetical protein
MNPRITSIENLIASDPAGRNIFGLVITDQLRLAAQSLRLGRRVGIVSGFYIPQAGDGETDGPPGAKALGDALHALGIEVDYITDHWCAPLFRALDIEPLIEPHDYVTRANPTHLVSVERPGRGRDGRYRNMRGIDISATTFPLDDLFLEATRNGLTTIGVGDGGNEIGMGKVFAEALSTIDHGADIASTVATDFCITAGVSNWGAYGLSGALSVLSGRDLLPTADGCMKDIDRVVRIGGAVDGVTHRHEPTVDGLDLSVSIRMLENIRRQIIPSPLERGESLLVGVLGYGETGRSASALLTKQGHRVRISDIAGVTLESGLVVDGVETGGHTIDFLQGCDLVVASPGVREDSSIRDELHRRAIPVMSELELAFQLAPRDLIAVTGTIGKRTTVELLRTLFASAGRQLTIGGNRGLPLSALLLDSEWDVGCRMSDIPHPTSDIRHPTSLIALAVSSFQLETVVHFRPHIAILLNINEAHLDRHRSIAEYIRIKSRIFMNHRPDDILILPFDDERLRTLSRKHHGRTFFVSHRQAVDRGAWLADGAIYTNIDGTVERLGDAASSGAYPYPENLLSAVIAARLCGLPINHSV